MTDNVADHYKGLAAQYTDNIRASDFKANIVLFFLSLTMGPIIFNRDKFPPFLTMPVVVAPFLVIFFCLFVALLPRFPQRGRRGFFISGKARPAVSKSNMAKLSNAAKSTSSPLFFRLTLTLAPFKALPGAPAPPDDFLIRRASFRDKSSKLRVSRNFSNHDPT